MPVQEVPDQCEGEMWRAREELSEDILDVTSLLLPGGSHSQGRLPGTTLTGPAAES